MPRPALTTPDAAVAAYLRAGSLSAAAGVLGVSTSSVRRALLRAGLTVGDLEVVVKIETAEETRVPVVVPVPRPRVVTSLDRIRRLEAALFTAERMVRSGDREGAARTVTHARLLCMGITGPHGGSR